MDRPTNRRPVAWFLLALITGCRAAPPPDLSFHSAQESPASPETSATPQPDAGSAVARDPKTGLILDDGWELVRTACVSCHSTQQFLRQRGTRRMWTDIVRWMEQKGGLGQLPEEYETRIIDYLARNHGPTDSYRRAPLPPLLLPENPYESEIRRQLREQQERKS